MLEKIAFHIEHGTLFSTLLNKARRNSSFGFQAEKLTGLIDNELSGHQRINQQKLQLYIKKASCDEQNSGLPDSYISELVYSIVERRLHRLTEDEDLIKATAALDINCMSSLKWLILCHISIYNGFFKVGYAARLKAAQKSILEFQQNPDNYLAIVQALKSSLDQGDLNQARAIFDLFSRKKLTKDIRINYDIYFSICTGDQERAKSLGKLIYTENDKIFAEYINGKSIAIVGPAPTGEDLADEIDSFDIVIRLNYRGKNSLSGSNEFGSRLDISYYNNECASIIYNASNKDFIDELKYIVFKSIEYRYQKQILSEQQGRILFSPNYYLFIGTANMIQNALYDLLHFDPKIIKVFKVNFYLSDKAYHDGYSIHEKRNDFEWRWQQFARHNFMTQLNFIKLLWKSGMIEVDKNCERVLNLKADKYVNELESIYVKRPLEMHSNYSGQ